MKVLMISTDRSMLKEGSPARARMREYGALFDELHIILFRKRSFRLSVFNFQKISDNVFVYPTNSFSRFFYIFDALKIGRRILASSFKLQVSSWVLTCQDPFETGIAGWRLSRLSGVPLQIQIHTDFLNPYFAKQSFLNALRVVIAKVLMPRADGLRVVSEKIKLSLLGRFPELAKNVSIMPIFVDVEKIKSASPKFDLHQRFPQFDFIILMVSRLSREKNIPMAIGAFAGLVKKYPKTGLVIVGDGPERPRLELHASRFTLHANVVFDGWQKEIVSYYKTADLFLNTSNYEGYGMSLVEALAAGCPVLSTNVGAADGLLPADARLPVGNERVLSEKLRAFRESPARIKEIAAYESERLGSITYRSKDEYLRAFSLSLEKLSGA